MSKSKIKPTIGWREWVALPEFRVRGIKAKIDTGARTSALHAYDVEIFRERGVRMAKFEIHPFQRTTTRTIHAEAEVVEQRWITSSNGERSLRPVILTTMEWLDQSIEIELTLTNRDSMGFRMLLGREAIRGRFLVDPGRSFLGGQDKKPKQKPSISKKKRRST